MKQFCNFFTTILQSYGLACILFFLLLALTFFGTMEQVDHGIYDVQKKYFNSFVLIHFLFDTIPIPLIGGKILLPLLCLNLIFGGILRIIKRIKRRFGLFITHLGVVLLLVSSFITFLYSTEGHITLYEGEQAQIFQSYFEWELIVLEEEYPGKYQEYRVPQEQFYGSLPEVTSVFYTDQLPFSLEVHDYHRNSTVLPGRKEQQESTSVVDGYFLRKLPPEQQVEQNTPGLYIVWKEKETSKAHEGILWGGQRYALPIRCQGKNYFLDLRPKLWELPFTIRLDIFVRELHPRTQIAKVFRSEVTKIESGIAQPMKITMNEPLRHQGYTLYQASWGPQNARKGEKLFSTFAVVNNPADQLPEYACLIIAFGMFFHFSQKLFRYVRRTYTPHRTA